MKIIAVLESIDLVYEDSNIDPPYKVVWHYSYYSPVASKGHTKVMNFRKIKRYRDIDVAKNVWLEDIEQVGTNVEVETKLVVPQVGRRKIK
jgi:hypothetical protein